MQSTSKLALLGVVGVGALAGCTDDPQYIQPDVAIEVGVGMDMGIGTVTLNLPYDLAVLTTDTDYQTERAELLATLNAQLEADGAPAIALDQISLVRLDQLDISLEWSITNLSDEDGQARIHVNGGNQFFYYLPINFVVPAAPGEDEEPPPPPLAGDIPINIAAGGSIGGVFREDQLRESALDLELITRGAINPFRALLTVHEDIVLRSTADVPFIQADPENPVAPPAPIPLGAFGHFVRFDITFVSDRHMRLDFSVRVRDHRGLLHDELLGAPLAELMEFAPVEFVPAPPPAP